MIESGHIEIKIYKYIFFHAGIRDFDTRNRDEFRFCSNMCLFRLMQHPRGQRHLVFTKCIAQIFILRELCDNRFNNSLRRLGCNGMLRLGLNATGNLLLNQRLRSGEHSIGLFCPFELSEGICLIVVFVGRHVKR